MKESIGGTQIFIIVVTLILLFSGIMALTINHSNAFAVKDQIVSTIEKHGGLDITLAVDDNEVLQEIVEAIKYNAYRQTGSCEQFERDGLQDYEVIGYQRNGEEVSGNNKASFCIIKNKTAANVGTAPEYYYQVVVFYTLDLPVVNEIFNFKVIGETKVLYK